MLLASKRVTREVILAGYYQVRGSECVAIDSSVASLHYFGGRRSFVIKIATGAFDHVTNALTLENYWRTNPKHQSAEQKLCPLALGGWGDSGNVVRVPLSLSFWRNSFDMQKGQNITKTEKATYSMAEANMPWRSEELRNESTTTDADYGWWKRMQTDADGCRWWVQSVADD